MSPRYPDPRGPELSGGIKRAVSHEIAQLVNLLRDSALDIATDLHLMRIHIGGQSSSPLVSDVSEFRVKCHELFRSCKAASDHSGRLEGLLGMLECSHENLEWEGTEPYFYRLSCDCGITGEAEKTPGGYTVKLD